MGMPLVSVLMTAYNREKYIAEAIESVLASTYTNWELIVVDDCSKDNTVPIARSYEQRDTRVKVYVNETNLGDYVNRNKAASYASGTYLKYLDSDDTIYNFGLSVFVSCMEANPETALGITGRKPQYSRPFPVVMEPEVSQREHFFGEGFLDCGPTGTIVRRDVFNKLGGFSGKRMIGDTECWLKIAAQYPVMILPASLVFWRQHDGQEFFVGLQTTMYLEMNLRMIEEAMASVYCKLTVTEKERIVGFYKKITARGLLKLALTKKEPGKALNLFRQLNLGVSDLRNAVFSMKHPLRRD